MYVCVCNRDSFYSTFLWFNMFFLLRSCVVFLRARLSFLYSSPWWLLICISRLLNIISVWNFPGSFPRPRQSLVPIVSRHSKFFYRINKRNITGKSNYILLFCCSLNITNIHIPISSNYVAEIELFVWSWKPGTLWIYIWHDI